MTGYTIRIYIPDEKIDGLKITRITTEKGNLIIFPRNKLVEAMNKSKITKMPLVYFLVGFDAEKEQNIVYVGQSQDCFGRMKAHDKNKEFWTHALVFTNVGENFNTAHIQYLERFCQDKIEEAERYILQKVSKLSPPHIDYSVKVEALHYFKTIELLTKTIGHNMFEGIRKSEQDIDTFVLKIKGITAFGQYNEEGFLVFKNSQVSKKVGELSPNYIKIRESLISKNIIKLVDNILVFQEDYLFNSPSQPAAIIHGYQKNGLLAWIRVKDGKTLKEVLESQ